LGTAPDEQDYPDEHPQTDEPEESGRVLFSKDLNAFEAVISRCTVFVPLPTTATPGVAE
jgi:hypothetical protein